MSGLLQVLTLISTIAVVVIGGLATWLVNRRRTSGQIGTSEAADLWTESKAMRDLLAAQLGKVEAQRDRLIEGQAGQVLPSLAALTTSLSQIAHAVELIIGHDEQDRARDIRMERMLVQLVESADGHGRADPPDQGEGSGD